MNSPRYLFDHASVLARIPALPGVYLMKDRQDTIVYIGKAKNLRARVRSYFSGADPRAFVPLLGRLLGDIDVVLTANEKEAIILENTLIKRHRPRFNFMLRDDKEFLRLRIDPREEWPWVRIVRREARDGAHYFGPYHSASAARETLRILNRHFQLRTCRDAVLRNRVRPCLQYEIKRCPGPCAQLVEREDYLAGVRSAILFLKGRHNELVEELQRSMLAASEALEFERAAGVRDQIRAVEKALERQRVVQQAATDQDIFGFYREGERVSVQLLYVRAGRLQGGDIYHFVDQLSEDAEVISQLLMQHYGHGAYIPSEVVLPLEVEAQGAFEELLGEERGRRVHLRVPKRGARRDLVNTATENAQHQFAQHHVTRAAAGATLEALRERLELQRTPERIECFDISNLQGGAHVGSMVVFVDGRPARSHYRTYKVRDVKGQDDFAALYEVVTRRYRRLAEGGEGGGEGSGNELPVPDLVVVDGGKGQLASVLEALEDLGVVDAFDVISLAKSRVQPARDGRGSATADRDVVHSPERVFRPGESDPIVLPQNSNAIFLLQQLRDEAHRVAIGFHRTVRSKHSLRSQLDEVSGIGPKRKAALLRHFGSLAAIRTASFDELLAVPGVNRPAARRLQETLRRRS